MNNIEVMEYKSLNEKLYKKVLNNGLTVYINQKPGLNKVFCSFITNFGANDVNFIPINKDEYITVPLGVAHFLEHKLFEMPDGIDASDLFASLGADSNAYTDFNETAYIVSCTSNVNQVICTLLDFVQSPYFTDQNVEKEQGIIIEELNMYKDSPNDQLHYYLMRNMYKVNLLREDVVGTKKSIMEINKEILYICYNTFYHPANMHFVISGDVDVIETFNLIEENQNKKSFPKFNGLKCKYNIENEIVFKRAGQSKMDIIVPKVSLGIKLPVFEYQKNEVLKTELIVKILLEYCFGVCSSNYQYMLDNELVNDFSYSCNFDDKSSYIKLSANSFNPKNFCNYIKKILLGFKKEVIDETAFNNIKKAFLGSFIRSFDSEEFICTSLVENIHKNSNIFDGVDIINCITINDLKEFSKYFNEKSFCQYIIYPKNV